VAYVDQVDRLHALLTVRETLEFAFRCCHANGGSHAKPSYDVNDAATRRLVEEMDRNSYWVNATLQLTGLSKVRDSLVGGRQGVRGVSGGEKKRTTVSEMFCRGVPVLCCDEMSTGLDSLTTYRVTKTLSRLAKLTKAVNIVSLLAPQPETVANFDEIVLLCEGRVVYSGPTHEVLCCFLALGYEIPDYQMNLADWLVELCTSGGSKYLKEEATAPASNAISSSNSPVSSDDKVVTSLLTNFTRHFTIRGSAQRY